MHGHGHLLQNLSQDKSTEIGNQLSYNEYEGESNPAWLPLKLKVVKRMWNPAESLKTTTDIATFVIAFVANLFSNFKLQLFKVPMKRNFLYFLTKDSEIYTMNAIMQ